MGKSEVNAAAHGPPFKKPLDALDDIQWPVPFSKDDWDKTPAAVRVYIPWLHQRITDLEKANHSLSQRIDDLETRGSQVNHIDETSFSKKNVLQWLWVMTNTMVAFFMIHPKGCRGHVCPQA